MTVAKGTISVVLAQFLLCSILPWFTISYCSAQQQNTGQDIEMSSTLESFKMENGLTVILLENHKESKVAVASFYRAGFMHEPRGKAHISHVVEHMVVQCATKSYKPRESFMLLQKKGMVNAETLASFAHYDYILPSSDLELALRIESERLTSIKFTEEILKHEIPKCLQEIEFVQKNPQSGLIKFGLIGLNQTIRFGDGFVPVYSGTSRLTVEDVQQFHKEHYGPENALLIIVGDFKKEAARRMVRKYFANVPKSQPQDMAAVEMSGDIRVNWDLGSNALYLVYPGIAEEVNERVTLTLFGNYLSGHLFIDAGLKKVTKISFCSNQLYPVGDLPFFIFAEAKYDEPIEGVREALKKVVEKALQDFNAMTFSQTKSALVSFMQSSILEGGFAPANIEHEMLLGQEAINLGIKELLRDGTSEGEYLRRIDDLDFEAASKILEVYLSEENEKEVFFLTVM